MKTHTTIRSLLCAAAFGSLFLLAAAAWADPPTTPPGDTTEQLAPPPQLFVVPMREDEGAAPAAEGAPNRRKWRSPALVAVGITGISLGVPTMLFGGLVTALSAGPYNEGSGVNAGVAVGSLVALTGGAMVAGGILGIVYGAKAPSVEPGRPSIAPAVALGPSSGSLTWRF